MKRIPLIILSILLASLVAVVSVYAQTGESTPLDENSASLSIVETIPVTASVDVSLNGQIYTLAIPVTVNIDAQKDLAEALLTAQEVDRVGVVLWRITEITEYEEEFDLSEYSELQPSSPDNKLVVIDSEVTNMDTEPYSYYASGGERFAYDELGNLYDPTDQSCDDINPGSTQSCLFVFDVPKTATILGLDLRVIDHKRVPFTAQE
jgi:hypothetical protein